MEEHETTPDVHPSFTAPAPGAMGPPATRPGDCAVPPMGRADPDRPVVEVVSRALLRDLTGMVRHEPGTRRGEDPEELHQMRVATRRLRSTLRTYRPVLQADWADALRARLRTTAEALGTVRDLDVLVQRLAAEDLDGPAVAGRAQLDGILSTRRQAARERLLAVLDDPDHAALLTELRSAAHAPRCLDPAGPAGPQLAPLATRAWKRLRKAERTMAPHDVRIRVKRLRYAAEAIEPAFGKPARRLAARAADAQDVLGEYQDAWVARQVYLELLDEQPLRTEAAFTIGVLVARADAAMATARQAWPDVWDRLRAKKRRRFLA
ncbi:MAG TPA: CHAD domain-containing protein [Euzebya sp.]|nr:CHAD domain-containing protein [Euzebya sp.]